ncbi:MAG: DUF177 domain-containing protein [bacterium]|nr:DUF177 domain-containing protein [bacterium]
MIDIIFGVTIWGVLMVLDLRRVFLNEGEVLPFELEFDFSELELFGRFPLNQPVKALGRVYNQTGIVYLDFVCKVQYNSFCDRCAVPIQKTYNLPVKYLLVSELENEDNDELLLIDDFKLDLKTLCESEVILGLEIKHLCKDDCKGICEICGKNLNEGSCGCSKKQPDPRFDVLRDLLK